ncbi:ankyrin, partial [Piromyces finnis]
DECQELTVSVHDLIYDIKKKIVIRNKDSSEVNDFTNYGLLLVSKEKTIKQFLEDKVEVGDLEKIASDFYLEFVPKYKILKKEDEENSSKLNNADVQRKFIDLINEDHDDQMIKDILELGIDPNFVTENGETPVSLCILRNKMKILKILLDNGAFIDYKMRKGKNWITYLQYAILCQNFDIIKFLIERGIWIEDKDKKNRTAIYYAIKVKNVDYVKYLLNLGSNIQCLDFKGFLPLHYACKKGNAQIVHFLIDYGSNLNFVDENGDTPLHIAMKHNHKECVRWLLIRGSRKDLPNNEGLKPIDINRANQCDEEIMKLVETFNLNDIIPPPPKFSLLDDKKVIKKRKDKQPEKSKIAKKKKSVIVKVPPPPPMFYSPKIVSELSNDSLPNLHCRSSSVSSLSSEKLFKPSKLEKTQSNKNIHSSSQLNRPSTEPNNRSPLRYNESISNIYDDKVYAPTISISSTPLSKSTELSPQTATNPEDQATLSVDTPRTAVKRISISNSVLYNKKNDEDNNDNDDNHLLETLKDEDHLDSIKNSNKSLTQQTEDSVDEDHLDSVKTSNKSLTQQKENAESVIDPKEDNNGTNENEEEKRKEKHIHNVPKIETAKIVLKNLVLSNPNLTTLTDSPRSAIYIPSLRKPSRMLNINHNYSSASSILSAFIKNDTSTILDNILNIDNENDSDENMNESLEDLDITNYKYSSEIQSEDNPNYDLLNKEINKELLDYLQHLSLMSDGEIISIEPLSSSKTNKKQRQRNRLKIDDKDYQNVQLNNKELLLEMYEKLYLILFDIQQRSKKAKESIQKIKEEHANLIKEIKTIREKELKSKANSKSMLSSLDEEEA